MIASDEKFQEVEIAKWAKTANGLPGSIITITASVIIVIAVISIISIIHIAKHYKSY